MNRLPLLKESINSSDKVGQGIPKSEPVAFLFLAGLVLLLGFALRVYSLGKQEFWFDEAASAFITTKHIPDIIAYIQAQFLEHPPVYYILLNGWIRLAGTSEFVFRYFSVFFGVVFLALLWTVTKPFASRWLSLSTIFIAAIFPFQILQSQETRMYTLVACLGALSIISFYRAIISKSYWWWIAVGVVTAVGTGTHYYFPLLTLSHCTYLLFNRHILPGQLRKWLPAAAFIAVAPMAIWLTVASGPRQAVFRLLQNWSPAFLWYEDIGRLGIETIFGTSNLGSSATIEQVGAGAILAVAGLGILLGRRYSVSIYPVIRPNLPILHSLLVFAVVIPVLIGLLMPHNLVARYLAFSHTALYLLIGLGITAIGRKGKPLFVLSLILLAAIFVYGNHFLFSDFIKGQFAAGAKIINSAKLPEDAIILTHPDQWPLVRYYMRADMYRIYYVPTTVQPISDEEVKSSLSKIAETHPRIWLGPVGAWNMDPQSKIENWLLNNSYRAFQQWLPQSTSVSLYFLTKSPLEVRPVNYRAGSSLDLRGYGISKEAVSAYGGIPVHLLWQRAPDFDSGGALLEGLRLVDENGRVWSEMTDVIEAKEAQFDTRRALFIPPGTPPGKYKVNLSIYSVAGQESLIFFEANTNQAQGAILTLAEIEVVRTDRLLPVPVNTSPVKGVFGEEIELLGIEAPTGTHKQGDNFTVSVLWQTLQPPRFDYSVVFSLVDGKGKQVFETQVPATSQGYSPANWRTGEVVKGVYEVPIPNDLPKGRYDIQIALRAPSTGVPASFQGERTSDALWSLWRQREAISGTNIVLTSLTVEERSRDFSAPRVAFALDENLGNQITLLGHSGLSGTARAGENFAFTLYWQATQPTSDSYTVFAHLLDKTGKVVAQQDILPKRGSYPTNLWVAGEYIEDSHWIDLPDNLPPGQYVLQVGMYNSKTLARLPILDPSGRAKDDKVLFPPVIVVKD